MEKIKMSFKETLIPTDLPNMTKLICCNECGIILSQDGSLENHKLMHVKKLCEERITNASQAEEKLHIFKDSGNKPSSKTLTKKDSSSSNVVKFSKVKTVYSGKNGYFHAIPKNKSVSRRLSLKKCPSLSTKKLCKEISSQKVFSIKHAPGDKSIKSADIRTEGKSEESFTCEMCDKTYHNHKSFKTHMRVHSRESAFVCNICSKLFSSSFYLLQHLNYHTGEKPYACKFCSRTFSTKNSLTKHLNIHTGEKQYICNVCSKRFLYSSNLRYHLKTHTGEKPFVCTICSKRFVSAASLKHHGRDHTGEKPFACTLCPRTFSRQPSLRYHLRTHTGEKPFSCDVCSMQFTSASHLRSHIKIHMGEKPFVCEVCNKSFSERPYLTKHLRVHARRNLKQQKLD